MDPVLRQYEELFQPKLGCQIGEPVLLSESKGANVHKDKAVPYALQSKVENTFLESKKRRRDLRRGVSAAVILIVGKKESEDVRVCKRTLCLD